MKVFITGINSFIGGALAKTLTSRGHTVVGSVSSKEKLASSSTGSDNRCVIPLNEEFDSQVFSSIDIIIHCAYDLRKGKSATNIEGTQKLAEAAIGRGVKWQIFIGSYSAHELATSEYGQSKLALEKHFLQLGQIVAKPGLVIGQGGLFLKMTGFLKYPIVPLVGGGNGKLPIISINDLTSALAQLVENPRRGCFRLWNDEQVSLKELLRQLKQYTRSNSVLVPVPFRIIYTGLWMSSKLGLPIHVDLGNLKGFQANQSVTDSSDLREFVPNTMPLTEMLKNTVSEHRGA